MIRYFKQYIDDNNFVHSIDNVVCIYDLRVNYNKVLECIQKIADVLKPKKYIVKLDILPCTRYKFWVHVINIDSCYICLGKHSEKVIEVNTGNKSWVKFDKMRIEINPNKWHDSDLFKMLMDMVKEVAYEGIIDCIDYAIDVPCNISDVVVLRSRKEYGEYKGTRYFGQRGKNGMVRIYNKMIESKLNYELTRIETRWKTNDKFTSVDFGIIRPCSINPDDKINISTKVIIDMLQELKMLGSDNVNRYLSMMNFRTREKVVNAMNGNLIKYKYDMVYLNKLMDDVRELFHCSVLDNPVIDDFGDVFMYVPDDYELPF